MALPVTNNNGAAAISSNGTYCTVQVPGYIPPAIAGNPSMSPQFASFAYQIVAGSTGAGTVVTFQSQGSDGVFRNLSSPAPITLANSTTYSSSVTGTVGAVQLAVSSLAGNGISYAQLSGTPVHPITTGSSAGGSTPWIDPHAAQLSVYDDFTLFPGLWGTTGTAPTQVANSGAQSGIVNVAPGGNLVRSVGQTGSLCTMPFGNIAKIVFRVVFWMNSVTLSGVNEIVLGFTHTGSNTSDAGNNLYGAFINFCPGYGGLLPDWNSRAFLAAGQLTGFTYGVYNGSSVSPALAGFGYKPSAFSAPVASHWYEGVISMIPGSACAFYIGNYGSPALDQTCTVVGQVPNITTAGPQVTVGVDSAVPASVLVDKIQYAVWTTEGAKIATDSTMYGF